VGVAGAMRRKEEKKKRRKETPRVDVRGNRTRACVCVCARKRRYLPASASVRARGSGRPGVWKKKKETEEWSERERTAGVESQNAHSLKLCSRPSFSRAPAKGAHAPPTPPHPARSATTMPPKGKVRRWREERRCRADEGRAQKPSAARASLFFQERRARSPSPAPRRTLSHARTHTPRTLTHAHPPLSGTRGGGRGGKAARRPARPPGGSDALRPQKVAVRRPLAVRHPG